MAKRIGFIVLTESGNPLRISKEALFISARLAATIFRTEARARKAIEQTGSYAARNGMDWHTEHWRIVPVAPEA